MLDKLGGTGFGDSPQIGDQIVTAHTDTVVSDSDRPVFFIKADPNFQIGITTQQAGITQHIVAQLINRIAGIGDQLTQENFRMRIERMDHQVQQLLHLRLEPHNLFWFTILSNYLVHSFGSHNQPILNIYPLAWSSSTDTRACKRSQ